ncbi:hypothetical protein MFIFM68171_01966 [Madurella fahalii]|uniref:Uncharacterized protein n=1 Tax=Madurella fahalii TaxID=1157608 RepID=A0ABQ0G1X7_9PEZI
MLRRRSRLSKSGIERRKSTSSMHGVHLEHLDPTVAQRDAYIAACKAYKEALSRTRADMSLFFPTRESSPLRQQAGWTGHHHDPSSPCPEHHDGQDIHRQQSVRFMGPCSVELRGSRSRSASSCRDSTDVDAGNCRMNGSQGQISELDDTDQNGQPPLHPRRPPPPVPLPEFAAAYLDALAAGDEYYTPEDDIASAPSSYRRLHQSKSAFTSDRPRIRMYQESSTSLLNRHSFKPPLAQSSHRLFRSDPSGSKVSHTTLPLRAPKSMSFWNSRNSHARYSTSQDDSARSSSLSGVPEEELPQAGRPTPQKTYKTSALFGSRSGQAEPRLRKSLRGTSSTEDLGSSSPITVKTIPETGSLRSKARNVSKSFKLRLKNIFNPSRPEKQAPSIPCQHIEARRTHVTDGFGTSQATNAEFEAAVDEGPETILSVSAKIPSLQEPPPGLIHSSKASLESLKSERERQVSDDASLTSWVHSGPNTLTSEQRQQWREWERQRLSVIKENGAHAPSPSIRRPPFNTELFQLPENVARSPGGPGKIVDSQRVYSALMKRMREIDNQTSQTAERRSRTSDTDGSAPIMESLDHSSNQTPDTIKHIAPARKSFTFSDALDTPTRPPRKATKSLGQLEHIEQQGELTSTSTTAVLPKELPTSSTAGSTDTLTIPHPTSPSIENTQSTWNPKAGNSPALHLFRTASPYRRALRRSMQEEQDAWARHSSTSESQLSDTGTQLIHPPDADRIAPPEDDNHSTGFDSANDLEYSESVYSDDDAAGAGAAADVASPACLPGCGRGGLGAGSLDWPAWLSDNIGGLEASPAPPSSLAEMLADGVVEYALPSMQRSLGSFGGKSGWARRPGPRRGPGRGHVREATQTCVDDDDDDDGGDRDLFEVPTRGSALPTTAPAAEAAPLTPVQGNVVRRPAARGSLDGAAKMQRDYYAGVENEIPGSGPGVNGLSPMLPNRSVLRPSPLRVSKGNVSPSVASSPGLTAALRRQFGSGAASGSWGESDKGRGFGAGAIEVLRRGPVEEEPEEDEIEQNYCRDVSKYFDDGRAFV